ncbi:hypothetical protein Y032_0549g3294 [Ancylostoma ceylanicum]|uniref:Uncharacterized protein n=1 Tax=Ancylostoma ceylanicum TaxID=53326 RepID=A0A016WQU0_9BILA|nr:hypothetical protein Y032_0549g3294 [Ancylostoma ceylanicum]
MNRFHLLLAFVVVIHRSTASFEHAHHEAPLVAEVPAVAHVQSVKHVPAVAHVPTVEHVPTVAHVPVVAAAAPVHEHHHHPVEMVHHVDAVKTETEHGGDEGEAAPYRKRKLAAKAHKKSSRRKFASKKAARKHRKHRARRH